eukprot:TRINITY_DN64855_c0_g1_i1.p1 TRINITY_DN64855_c0_g1~~TRINITY_DN64855_c0_g1_i1.p1  ORF type:complete len:487 (+),score=143.51 TRINITY_DN64855_c0_g1_i1:88-1461(+)
MAAAAVAVLLFAGQPPCNETAFEQCASAHSRVQCGALQHCLWCESAAVAPPLAPGDSCRSSFGGVCAYAGATCSRAAYCTAKDPSDSDLNQRLTFSFTQGQCPTVHYGVDKTSCDAKFDGSWRVFRPGQGYRSGALNGEHCVPHYAAGCSCLDESGSASCGSDRGPWCNLYTEKCTETQHPALDWNSSRTGPYAVCCKECFMTPRAAVLIIALPVLLNLCAIALLAAALLHARRSPWFAHRRSICRRCAGCPAPRGLPCFVLVASVMLWLFSFFMIHSRQIVCGAAGVIHSFFTLIAHSSNAPFSPWTAVLSGLIALALLWGWGMGQAGAWDMGEPSELAECSTYYDNYFSYNREVESGSWNPQETTWGYCRRGWVAAVLFFRVFALLLTVVLTSLSGHVCLSGAGAAGEHGALSDGPEVQQRAQPRGAQRVCVSSPHPWEQDCLLPATQAPTDLSG